MAHALHRISTSASLVFALAIAVCNLSAAAQSSPATAFIHVNVVPMDREIVLRDQTVIVKDGRIVALGSTRSIKVPKGSRRIEASSHYLMPGLADMHVHFIRPAIAEKMPSSADTYAEENPRLALLFVANGVTTVRNMWGHPAIRALNDEIQKGRLIGPTIYSVGPITDGDPPSTPGAYCHNGRAGSAGGSRGQRSRIHRDQGIQPAFPSGLQGHSCSGNSAGAACHGTRPTGCGSGWGG